MEREEKIRQNATLSRYSNQHQFRNIIIMFSVTGASLLPHPRSKLSQREIEKVKVSKKNPMLMNFICQICTSLTKQRYLLVAILFNIY